MSSIAGRRSNATCKRAPSSISQMAKFVPRQRKHKVLARQKSQSFQGETSRIGGDPNAVEILPSEKVEREERKRKMREELKGSQQRKFSGKKAKRLEKYIVCAIEVQRCLNPTPMFVLLIS